MPSPPPAAAIAGTTSLWPVSTPARPLLPIPVEIFTDIFKLAVDYDWHPSTPFTAPPMLSKSVACSLLLSSKPLRELMIPLVYRTITIARPKDWIIFFGVGRGALVTGYDLDDKKKAVKEICVFDEVAFPLTRDLTAFRDVALDEEGYRSELELLDPLDYAKTRLALKCLTLYCSPEKAARVRRSRGREEARALTEAVPADKVLHDILVQSLDSAPVQGARERDSAYAERLADAVNRVIEPKLEEQKQQAWVDFLHAVYPSTIRAAPCYIPQRWGRGWQAFQGKPVRLVTYEPDESEENERGHTFEDFALYLVDMRNNVWVQTSDEEAAELARENGAHATV